MGRRRRVREMERRLAELDEWDRIYGVGGTPPGHPLARDTSNWRYHSPDGLPPIGAASRPMGVHRPRRRRVWPAVLAVLGLGGAAVVAIEYPEQARSAGSWAVHAGERLIGTDQPAPSLSDSPPEAAPDVAPDVLRGPDVAPEPDAPAPDVAPEPDVAPDVAPDMLRGPDVAPEPEFAPLPDDWGGWRPATGERVLPPVEASSDGAYVFMGTQPGTDEAVGFSPCGSIEVVVNPAGSPAGYAELVQDSLDRISGASGLHLVLVGETDEAWVDEPRAAGLPILVTWADAQAVPALGESAGIAGPSWFFGPDGRWWSGSGQVVINPALLPTWEALSAVLDHEFAHVIGLGHVGEPSELMAPVNTGQASFGPGDLAGLAALGSIPCPSV